MEKNLNQEIMRLIGKYGTDLKRALRENKRLEYLRALSVLRENLLEWHEFRPDASLLQAGADFGALTGFFSRKVRQVTVLDESRESLDVVAARLRGAENVRLLEGSLEAYARRTPGENQTPEDGGQKGEGAGEETRGMSLTEAFYDYVTLIGGLRGTKEERASQIDAAKAVLAPGGELILAACNRFGMKYWAGAEREDGCVTRRELLRLLPGGSFYYPMPDYRLPSALYSEQYLPKKGDLTNDLSLYDYPQYLLMDVGAAYDAVCEDGQFDNFANSFLVIWKKER